MLYTGIPPTEVVQRPVVGYDLVRKEGSRTAFEELQFICSFPPKEKDYLYQVIWHIGDEPVTIKDAVKMDFINNTHLGYDDKDSSRGYQKFGFNVRCNTV